MHFLHILKRIDMIEFFTIERIILLIAWSGFVIVFFRSYNRHKKDIYNNLKGQDGVWQASELASWYWFKFFPYTFFLIFLIAIVQLEFTDAILNLVIAMVTALNTVFAVVIAGKSWGNSKTNGSDKLGRGSGEDKGSA